MQRGIFSNKILSDLTPIPSYCHESKGAAIILPAGKMGEPGEKVWDTFARSGKLFSERATRCTESVKIRGIFLVIDRGDQRFDYLLSAEEAVEVGLVSQISYKKIGIFSE